MATPSQLHQYCLDHGFTLANKGTHMFGTMFAGTLTGDVLIAIAGYLVVRFGIETVWSWMKSAYTAARTGALSVVSTVESAAKAA